MAIDPRTPTTSAEQRLIEMIRDLERRVQALELKAGKQ